MVNSLAYTYMGIATLFAAPLFSRNRGGVERWVRRLCLLNGAVSVLVFLSYVFYSLLDIWWSISFPALVIVLAVHLRQGQRGDAAE